MASPVLFHFAAETGIATVTFNRPEVFNALDLSCAVAFEEAVRRLRATEGLRCVVLTGAGKAFMAGGDVGAFAADLDAAPETLAGLLRHIHPALIDLRALDAPIVAAVNGVAAGAGLSIVAGADYVIARESARLMLAYDKLGVVPDCGGTWFLTRKIGRSQAMAMMLTGASFTAAEAMAHGLVNEVVADTDFEQAVRQRVESIASGPTRAFGLFKRLMDEDAPLTTQLERERHAFMAAARTDDFRRAATAFVERQPARFEGR